VPERRAIGIVPGHLSLLLVCRRTAATVRTSIGMFVRPLVRYHDRLLRAFDQSLPLAIGQQRQTFVGAVRSPVSPRRATGRRPPSAWRQRAMRRPRTYVRSPADRRGIELPFLACFAALASERPRAHTQAYTRTSRTTASISMTPAKTNNSVIVLRLTATLLLKTWRTGCWTQHHWA
jgi:hypothetical protein